MPRLRLSDIEVHYQQSGQGPDVVLIHGFTSNLAMWAFSGIIEDLRSRFRVTAYDLRGHGLSSAPASRYTSADMAADYKQLHAALSLGSAIVVGHSFGGVIGMHAAAVYPETVAGVIVCDSYFPGLAHLEPSMPEAEVWQDLRRTLAQAAVEIGERVDFRRLIEAVANLTPSQTEQIKEALGAPGARWLAQLGSLVRTTAAEETFAVAGLSADVIIAVQQPVVALYDEQSPFFATCRFLTERLPRCKMDVIPGAAHLALLQNPAGFVEAVGKHLDDMAQAAGTISRPQPAMQPLLG